MTDERMAELRAMFDEMADHAKSHLMQRQRWRIQPDDNTRIVTYLLLHNGTLASALVELTDELRDMRNRLELLHAHSENLIERVYELEGGDEREVHPR